MFRRHRLLRHPRSLTRVLLCRRRLRQPPSRPGKRRRLRLHRNRRPAVPPTLEGRKRKPNRRSLLLRFLRCNRLSVPARRRRCRERWSSCRMELRSGSLSSAANGCLHPSVARWKERADFSSNPRRRFRTQTSSGLIILLTKLTFSFLRLNSLNRCFFSGVAAPSLKGHGKCWIFRSVRFYPSHAILHLYIH